MSSRLRFPEALRGLSGQIDEPPNGKIKEVSSFVSRRGEPAELRKQNYRESVDWYAGIVGDVFG